MRFIDLTSSTFAAVLSRPASRAVARASRGAADAWRCARRPVARGHWASGLAAGRS